MTKAGELEVKTEIGFTPGPWAAHQNQYGEFALVRCGSDETIALLDDTEGNGDWLEYEANARLMAAAPDLYWALDLAREHFIMNGAATPRVMEKIAEALTKARPDRHAKRQDVKQAWPR